MSAAVIVSLTAAIAFAHEGHGGPPALVQSESEAPKSSPPAPAEDAAEKDDENSWDVNNPPLETRAIKLDVTEGTWMNIDIAPDGKTIAFDLLGDIYTMPIAGGTATNISSGLAYEVQPRFSPSGEHIAFTSDRAGGDNIWIMKTDGSDKRQVTKESFRLMNNPTWSPDGRYIAAKKHFTTGRSLGTGEIWLYHLGGGGGVALVERPNENHQKELGEPVYSPDGEYIYYTRNVSSGGQFIYAQDSNTSLFEIERYEMKTGDIETAVSGPGGSVRAAPSPDGELIAFVRRERGKSKLYLKELRSGVERKVYDDLDQDMQETWGVQGVYPNMDWTPDGQSLVFWAGGKIINLNVATGAAKEIPFRVTDTRDVIDPPRPQIDVAPDRFETKMPRFAAVSPNGRQVVFESLGKLYIKALPNGAPRRLTRLPETENELFPAWSADGSKIVFVSWNDETLGTIHTVANTGAAMRALTAEPGHYRRPRFSPDGSMIVFEKGSGGYLTSGDWSETTGIYRLQTAGLRTMTKVKGSGSSPHFAADNDRIFMTMGGGGSQSLVSVDLNGQDKRTHASAELVTEYQVAPNGEYVAFRENYSAYVMPLTPGPQSLGAGSGGSDTTVIKASGDGALYLNWAGDNRLFWSLGPTLFSAALDDMIPSLPASEDDDDEQGFEPPTEGVSLSRTVTAAKPTGSVAITGARIVTMQGDDGGVIEDGVIVLDGNRIAAVGAADDVSIPAGARRVDGAGKTIIPGLIDAHAHGGQGADDIIPHQNWLAVAHLAFGVTTVHDPSNRASHIFAASERQRAGRYLAPRLFSTGEIVYGAKAPGFYAQIDSIEDARAHVKRLKKQGAHSIKNYNQPRRDQRQQVVAAAIEENIAVVPEGGSLFNMDMSLIADGNTTVEHNIPQAKLYEDVLSFYAATKVAYTPTLVVTYGGLAGDPYWRFKTNVWEHPILSNHVPPHVLQPKSVRATKAPEGDFVDQVAAAAAKELADRGVKVSIGAHGQEEGLAAHWEMWSFARGGMSPLEALKTATIWPAEALGFDKDLGTLEEGKLADLVILTENPLDDIRNSDKIEHVMINGRLYEASTMNETVTGTTRRAPYYWE